jgi:hypothetical protein
LKANRLSLEHFSREENPTMKSFAALLALSATASAFTSTQSPTRSTSLQAAGNIDFRGKEFVFDPVSAADHVAIFRRFNVV